MQRMIIDMLRQILAGALLVTCSLSVQARESVVVLDVGDGTSVSYLLVAKSEAPAYTIIGFPGGSGVFNASESNGSIHFSAGGNFVIRTRNLMVDDQFAMALTDATSDARRMGRIVDDLRQRYPQTKIYLMSTSNGTRDSTSLSLSLGDKITGAIHTSSLSQVGRFPFDQTKVRQLLVHHLNDGCRASSFGVAQGASAQYHVKLITITGGIGHGDPCEPWDHHGYAGVERQTIDAIKAWVREG
jgi:hypothetical protein